MMTLKGLRFSDNQKKSQGGSAKRAQASIAKAQDKEMGIEAGPKRRGGANSG